MTVTGSVAPKFWMLLSPALPVGGYSYSQGLEYAVPHYGIDDADAAMSWIIGLAEALLPHVDLPVLLRLHRAAARRDEVALANWNARLLAMRESAELQDEDFSMGTALARLLRKLPGADWARLLPARPTFAAAFAVASQAWHIDEAAAGAGYLWVWAENQVAAAVKLVPLGQTDGQRILFALAERLPDLVARAAALGDDDIGRTMPALGIAGARHETQPTRLFRS